MTATGLPPLALYVHLPWCVRKCPYCDFNSHTAGDAPPTDRYLDALLADLGREAGRAGGRELTSIFIGGGTPSLFSPAQIENILGAAAAALKLADDCEITMEANPGTVDRGDFRGYRSAGVNRLSLGAQSFDAEMLAVLGRIHGPDEILSAFDEAASAGFERINLDLMIGLPGQDAGMAAGDVRHALALDPGHISCYQLTLEPNTVFYSRPPEGLPDDELSFAIQERCYGMLEDAGYERYEVSAFAKSGQRCRHNLNYWTFGDYLAVGAGAHGKLTATDGQIGRYRKPAHPAGYIAQQSGEVAPTPPETLAAADACFEYLLNALRLPGGFAEEDFEARTGLGFAEVRPAIVRARDDGLLERSAAGHWRPTGLGFRFLNELTARFLP